MHRTKVRIVEDALDANNTIARANRDDFDRTGVSVVNLMSAPGAGKTTLLEATLRDMNGIRVGVLEGDVQGSADADRIAAMHIPVVQLNTDGGFGAARGQGSSELYSAWAAIGLAAVGRDPASVRRGGHSVLDSLRAEVSTLNGLGDAERTILAARACGASSYSFAGRNLVAEVLRARDSEGSFEHLVNLTAFAIFALRAVGHSQSFSAIRDAAGWIERQQNSDGGFGFGGHGSPSDVDDTGAALQALADAGAHNARILGAAADFLIRSQNLDGGYPQQYGGESNAQSTSWALQGLIAAGDNPNTVRRRGSRSPTGYLQSLLAPGGSIRYSRTGAQTPVWVTAQALIALAGKTFPVGP